MKYFLDFDRTVFDTETFKKAVAKRPPLLEVSKQLKNAIKEILSPAQQDFRRRHFLRTLGTYASHGRFAFTAEELRGFLYPDAVRFLKTHHCTIVTYGVRAFITAKVSTALIDFTDLEVEYTSRKKGRTIDRLAKVANEPCTFIDDAVFQLESVSEWCPDVKVIEIRRNGGAGDGRWPVIHSFDEVAE
jgi:hypothetical protein